MTSIERLKGVAALLKKRFPNLTVEETIDLAAQILDFVEGIKA